MEINIEELAKKAFDDVVKEAAKQAIADKIGSGINSPVKEAIFGKAVSLVNEDEELKSLIKTRLKHWISRQ